MKDYNTNYIYKQVNSSEIYSDPTYQRVIDYNRVKQIVANFNSDLVNPIKVSKRDGKYYVFDGQHTLAALKARNNNKDIKVECKVYSGLSQQEEARLFAEQNGLARIVQSNAKMKALYTANDTEIVELHDTIVSLGIIFDFSKNKAPYKIISCATIYKIFKQTSKSEFCDILEIIRDAWCGEPDSYGKEILEGVHIFYKTYKGMFDKNKAISQFGKVHPQQIIRDGKLFTYGGYVRFARPLVAAYNKKLRVKLDESLIEKV